MALAIVDRTRPSSSVNRPAIVHPPGAFICQLGSRANRRAGQYSQRLTRDAVF